MEQEYLDFMTCLKKTIKIKEGGRGNLKKLAQKIGIPKSTLFGIMEENRDPRGSNLFKLIKYAECNIICSHGEKNSKSFSSEMKAA